MDGCWKKKTDRALLTASASLYLRSKPSRLLSAKSFAAASRLLSKALNIPLPILYYRDFIGQYYRFVPIILEIGA